MSYLVLARKYRPKNFTEMVGQEHVVQALSNALTSQRLHHAYLFTGTRGVGKTTVSRILAKALNCVGTDGQGSITANPCNVCEACGAIDAGRFVDYTELDAASNRGVEEVQQLLEQALYKPVQGRFKVFMIDEVHMLSNTAFNAMLKTLEEPPEYLKFVLATTDPQKVPVTVLSRCLQFNLRPMAPATVRTHLQHILSVEQIAFETGALQLLAKNAHGSMRDALSLTDQAIAFGDGVVQEAQVRSMLGAVDERYVFELLTHLAQNNGVAVIEAVQKMQSMGLRAGATLDQMADVLHRMLVSQTMAGQESQRTDDDEQAIAALALQMPSDEIQLLYSICLHGKADIGLASDEYSALTMVLLRLLAFKPPKHELDSDSVQGPSKSDIPRPLSTETPKLTPRQGTVDSDRSGVVTAVPIPVRVQAMAATPSKTEISAVVKTPAPQAPQLEVTPLGNVWFNCVRALIAEDAIAALARELAVQSQLINQDGDLWVLQLDNSLLAHPTHVEKLQTALQAMHPQIKLQVQTGPVTDSPAKRLAKAAYELQNTADQLITQDAALVQLMREFDATIVPQSITPITL